jgi:uncharacterized protein
MDKRTNKAISKYIESIAKQNPRLSKVYLFGSYAKQTDRPESDIDIALIIENLKDDERFDLQVQMMVFASDFDIRIEPHPISSDELKKNNPFVSEIVKTGIEIEPKSPNAWY